MATGRDKREPDRKMSSSARQLLNDTLSLGFTVVIFVLIGVFLNNVFNISPWGILIGVFFALASMVYFMVKLVRTK